MNIVVISIIATAGAIILLGNVVMTVLLAIRVWKLSRSCPSLNEDINSISLDEAGKALNLAIKKAKRAGPLGGIMDHKFFKQFNGDEIDCTLDGYKINTYICEDKFNRRDLNVLDALEAVMKVGISKGDLDPSKEEDRNVIKILHKSLEISKGLSEE